MSHSPKGGMPPSKVHQHYASNTRESTFKFAEKVEKMDTENLTNTQLFDLVDADQSGSISRQEFDKVVQVIRTNIIRTHKQETEAERSARRLKMMRSVLIALSIFVFITLLGNMGLSYAVFQFARETSVSNRELIPLGEGSASSTMTDRYDHIVQTGSSISRMDLSELFASGSAAPPSEIMNRIERITYSVLYKRVRRSDHASDEAFEAALMAGTRNITTAVQNWYSFTTASNHEVVVLEGVDGARMSFSTNPDEDAVVTTPTMRILPATTHTSFEHLCTKAQCPTSSCDMGISSINGDLGVTEVFCGHTSLWKWPSPAQTALNTTYEYPNKIVSSANIPGYADFKAQQAQDLNGMSTTEEGRQLSHTPNHRQMTRCANNCRGRSNPGGCYMVCRHGRPKGLRRN